MEDWENLWASVKIQLKFVYLGNQQFEHITESYEDENALKYDSEDRAAKIKESKEEVVKTEGCTKLLISES